MNIQKKIKAAILVFDVIIGLLLFLAYGNKLGLAEK